MFRNVIVWGTELSPYYLKLRSLMDVAEIPYQCLPVGAGRWRNTRVWLRLSWARRRKAIARWPQMTALDEYPAVPFLLEDRDPEARSEPTVWYDSTGIGLRMDATCELPCGRLVPEDPALAFVVRFVEEAFDELGLYLVHHHRWVVSAITNDAGRRLARDFAKLLPPGGPARLARRFPHRQVRRLPYLFSVAPRHLQRPAPEDLEAPAPDGFPATHELLEWCWNELADAVEELLAERPFLFGKRFTLADAAVFGQFGMNLTDGESARWLARRTPGLYAWLHGIQNRSQVGRRGDVALGPELTPLLSLLMDTFVPLMQANEAAYERHLAAGETVWNEEAFDAGRALYEGTICSVAFKSVVKTFQVQVWRDLRELWEALDDSARTQVEELMGSSPFDCGGGESGDVGEGGEAKCGAGLA